MTFKETMAGFAGEFMLFLTLTFLVAAVASILASSGEDPQGYVAIGTPFVVAAGAMYTARDFLEKRRFKRLLMTLSISAVSLAMSGVGVAGVTGGTVGGTVIGFVGVTVLASIATSIIYFLRAFYLIKMYCRKLTILKGVRSGNYLMAVEVAEGIRQADCGTNYVKNPEKLGRSVALALSYALERVGRWGDARRVRLAIESRNPPHS